MCHGHLDIEAFTDTNRTGSKTSRRTNIEYCTLVGGLLLSWGEKQWLKDQVLKQNNKSWELLADVVENSSEG